jgi:hypothetical protein
VQSRDPAYIDGKVCRHKCCKSLFSFVWVMAGEVEGLCCEFNDKVQQANKMKMLKVMKTVFCNFS